MVPLVSSCMSPPTLISTIRREGVGIPRPLGPCKARHRSHDESDEHLVREDAAARRESNALARPADQTAAVEIAQRRFDPPRRERTEAGGEPADVDPAVQP